LNSITVPAVSKKMIILHAAARLFARNGFNNTSMAELSAVTGAAGGTIFYHFKNKEALFLAILADVKEKILADSSRHFDGRQYETGLEMLEGVIAFYFDLAEKMADRFLLLHRHDPYRMAEANPVCREHLEAIYNCIVDIFERAVRRGQKDGTIRKLSPRKAALIVFSMVDGIVRLDTFKLYDAGALYHELLGSCRRMLQP